MPTDVTIVDRGTVEDDVRVAAVRVVPFEAPDLTPDVSRLGPIERAEALVGVPDELPVTPSTSSVAVGAQVRIFTSMSQ